MTTLQSAPTPVTDRGSGTGPRREPVRPTSVRTIADMLRRTGCTLMHRPGNRPRPLVELTVVVLCYLAYEGIRIAVRGDADEAIYNARVLNRLETGLHLDPERALNHALSAQDWLSQVAGYYYATLHFVVTPLVLIWLYRWHPGRYAWLRRTIAAATLPSLLVFWAMPLSPPRFAVPGITDTLAQWNILGGLAPRGSEPVANLYAAMPSLHFAWASWCALAVWLVVRQRHPVVAWLAWFYPALTGLDVMATGNHYLLDLVGGAGALCVGMVFASLHGRVAAVVLRRRVSSRRALRGPGAEERGQRGLGSLGQLVQPDVDGLTCVDHQPRAAGRPQPGARHAVLGCQRHEPGTLGRVDAEQDATRGLGEQRDAGIVGRRQRHGGADPPGEDALDQRLRHAAVGDVVSTAGQPVT